MTSEFGTVLRRLRRQAGMTQEQLAERSGVGVRTIRRLETGEPTDPRTGTVKLLADALGITPNERRTLLSLVGETPSAERIDAATAEDAGKPVPVPMPHDALPALRSELAEAAEQLAEVVRGRWQREEEQRRIHDPFPLPVRWRRAAENLTDHWENMCGAQPGATSSPLALIGQLGQIVDVYRQIPSGRLVVLGRAGSGKTILTIRFLLDFLGTRTSGDTVPVIFSLGSWNPATTSLRDWLIGQLVRDYPGLDSTGPSNAPLAAALVEAGRVLPVLDGFDEIAEGLHRAALEALNATTLPLLLTSRPDEYATAVAGTDVLTSAAGIELTDLTVTDLVNYLPRTTRKTTANGSATATVWDPVLTELRDQPHNPGSANLAAVLTTPLMVTLARTIYSDTPDHDPAELLNTNQFSTPEAVEDHLSANFIPTVYRHQPDSRPAGYHRRHRRNWDLDSVQHWLGYLAQHLNQLGTHDLAWWQLGTTMRQWQRMLLIGIVAGLGIGLVESIVNGLLLGLSQSMGLGILLVNALLEGLATGAAAGLAFGLAHGLAISFRPAALTPSRVHIRLLRRTRQPRARFVPRFRSGFLFGLAGGLVFGLMVGLAGRPLVWLVNRFVFGLVYGFIDQLVAGLVNTVVYGLVFGLGAGLVFGLVARFEAPLDTTSAASPTALLHTNGRTAIFQFLLFGPVFGLTLALGGWFAVNPLPGIAGPLQFGLVGAQATTAPFMTNWGIVGALGGGLAYVLSLTAWGQWVILARIWLPLTGRLPWELITFLEDAYQRGVLRQAGAVYQFRHAWLQDHLSRTFRARHTRLAPIGSGHQAAPVPVRNRRS